MSDEGNQTGEGTTGLWQDSQSRDPFAIPQILIGLTFAGIALKALVIGGFPSLWLGFPQTSAFAGTAASLLIALTLAGGIGLLIKPIAKWASGLLAVLFALWFLSVEVPTIFAMPLVEMTYLAVGMTAVPLAATAILTAWQFQGKARQHVAGTLTNHIPRIAQILFGLSLLAFGASHFIYMEMTAPLVPHWLGSGSFWATLTGITYIAAGLAVLTGRMAKLAATLTACQMALFVPLVWVPIMVAGAMTAFQWIELENTIVLALSAWILAESYPLAEPSESAMRV